MLGCAQLAAECTILQARPDRDRQREQRDPGHDNSHRLHRRIRRRESRRRHGDLSCADSRRIECHAAGGNAGWRATLARSGRNSPRLPHPRLRHELRHRAVAVRYGHGHRRTADPNRLRRRYERIWRGAGQNADLRHKRIIDVERAQCPGKTGQLNRRRDDVDDARAIGETLGRRRDGHVARDRFHSMDVIREAHIAVSQRNIYRPAAGGDCVP